MRSKVRKAPHIPFYKDERILGKTVTVSVSLRVFLLAIVIVVVAFGWALFYSLDATAALHNYVTKAHDSRMADQKAANDKVNQLGCYILANAPDNPDLPLIAKARIQYECAPYGKDPNFVPPKKNKKP